MGNNDAESPPQHNFLKDVLYMYGCIFLWVFLSAFVILVNKYVLAYSGFAYPIALTLSHMGFCSVMAFGLMRAGIVDPVNMDMKLYISGVLPIAALFATTLWLSNAAYLYLSVSFLQMVKASMPVNVYIVSCVLQTEVFALKLGANMLVVAFGIAIASYGELHFNVLGVTLQAGALLAESFRLVLVQILLQKRGIKLNPVTTLYYIAPACFGFLLVPFLFLEVPKMMNDSGLIVRPAWLLLSALGAFGLNMSVFLLIGRTSALTMNVAGVIKDWMLILLSVLLYGSSVTQTQLGGYGVAFLGVCWYNYTKLSQAKQDAAKISQQQQVQQTDVEKVPLLSSTAGNGDAPSADK